MTTRPTAQGDRRWALSCIGAAVVGGLLGGCGSDNDGPYDTLLGTWSTSSYRLYLLSNGIYNIDDGSTTSSGTWEAVSYTKDDYVWEVGFDGSYTVAGFVRESNGYYYMDIYNGSKFVRTLKRATNQR